MKVEPQYLAMATMAWDELRAATGPDEAIRSIAFRIQNVVESSVLRERKEQGQVACDLFDALKGEQGKLFTAEQRIRGLESQLAEHRGASTRALELWAMDVLSAGARLQAEALHIPGDREPELMMVPITAAGRLAAARSWKKHHPELPDEPKGSE